MVRIIKKTIKKETVHKKESRDLEIPVLDINSEEKEIIKLPEEVFQVEAKPALIAQYIRVFLSNQRQGSASTKKRGEVSGSTRKIYQQKGTGRARHGDIKAPIFVGGGTAHGPKPRDFSLKINKKQKRKVLLYSLTLKNKEGKIIIVDDSILNIKPKAKEAEKWLDKLIKNEDKKKEKILVIFPKMERNNLLLAIRNLSSIDFLPVDNLNGYEILRNDYLIFLKSALDKLIKVLLKENK